MLKRTILKPLPSVYRILGLNYSSATKVSNSVRCCDILNINFIIYLGHNRTGKELAIQNCIWRAANRSASSRKLLRSRQAMD